MYHSDFILKVYSLGAVARKPRPITAERCSMNVTDVAHIFTVGRPNICKKNLKISAQTDESFSRYNPRK